LPGIGIALSPVPIPYRKPKRGELRCELLIDGGVADGEGRIPVEQPELLDVRSINFCKRIIADGLLQKQLGKRC